MNKVRKGIIALIIFLGLVAFLPSCKTIRPLTLTKIKARSFDFLYHEMQAHKANYHYLSAKMLISYHNGASLTSFRARLRLKEDSLIWISIMPAMGIEVARVELTTDSLKFLNRMKKIYALGSYKLLDSLLHTSIGYKAVQALILGNDISGYQLQDSSSRVEGQNYLLKLSRRKIHSKEIYKNSDVLIVMAQKIWLDPLNFRIRKLDIREIGTGNKEKHLLVFYDKYQNVQGQLLPTKMRIVFDSRPKTEIFITFKKIVLDKPFDFPFIIPKDYHKMF